MIQTYIDYAITHPIAAFIEAFLILYLILQVPTILVLIPGTVRELREKRRTRRREFEDASRTTPKGPWG